MKSLKMKVDFYFYPHELKNSLIYFLSAIEGFINQGSKPSRRAFLEYLRAGANLWYGEKKAPPTKAQIKKWGATADDLIEKWKLLKEEK